jgi:hypothetical protein
MVQPGSRCTLPLRTHTPILVIALDLYINAHALQYVAHMAHNVRRKTSRDRRLADSPVVRADNTLGRRDMPPHELRKAWHALCSLCPGAGSAVGAMRTHPRRRIFLGIDTSGEHHARQQYGRQRRLRGWRSRGVSRTWSRIGMGTKTSSNEKVVCAWITQGWRVGLMVWRKV